MENRQRVRVSVERTPQEVHQSGAKTTDESGLGSAKEPPHKKAATLASTDMIDGKAHFMVGVEVQNVRVEEGDPVHVARPPREL